MHGQDRFRFRSDAGFDFCRIDVHRLRIDVSKHRRGARVHDRVDVAQKVIGVVITSSPGPIPAASTLKWIAAVHELTAAASGRGLCTQQTPFQIEPPAVRCRSSPIRDNARLRRSRLSRSGRAENYEVRRRHGKFRNADFGLRIWVQGESVQTPLFSPLPFYVLTPEAEPVALVWMNRTFGPSFSSSLL